MARGGRKSKYNRSKRSAYNNNHKYSTKGSHFGNKKRKHSHDLEHDSDKKGAKRRNFEDPRQNLEEKRPSCEKEVEDEGECEEEDSYKKLLTTFAGIAKKPRKVAACSDESSESESGDNIQQDADLTEPEDYQMQPTKETNDRTISDGDDDDDDAEEDNEQDIDMVTEVVQEEEALDPFICHFQYDLDEALLKAVTSTPQQAIKQEEPWPVLGQLQFHIPRGTLDMTENTKSQVILKENKTFAKCGNVPSPIITVDWSKLYIKSQIQKNLHKANSKNVANNNEEHGTDTVLTPLQKELFSIINNYQDLYFPSRTLKNGEQLRFLYCLHAVNHVLKTRMRILHHNAKLARRDEVPDEFRDQGLVRPKVLIVVPFKDSAFRVVEMISSILLPDDKANVINKSRFLNEFTGNELQMPKKNPRPDDYEATFTGNTDDTFRVGLRITKKSLRLYADFYSSDIIVASPLGMRVIIGADGESGRDFDFLASIEVLVMDQMEIFLMQNWDHVLHMLDHLHLQPSQAHGTDFARVRSWAVNGWTHYYRQSILLSSLILPEFNAVFNKKCCNYAGKARVVKHVRDGSICQVIVQLPQVFQKIPVDLPTKAIDSRFDFFIKKVLPQYRDSIMNHTLIYIPSYFDYVRVRNYFKREELSFVQLCEYFKEAKIARARDLFFHSEAHFLLFSERFHFFRRLRIKGIRHIIFYQPPTFPHFYSELCNFMQEANQSRHGGSDSNMTVTVLYTKYDAHQLAAIVGTDRTTRMLMSEQGVHMFTTDDMGIQKNSNLHHVVMIVK